MSRKKKALPPRRKRMNRSARLNSAHHWLPTYKGKNIVRGYAKWYGVDLLCAINELRALGVAVDPTYEQQVRVTMENRARERARRRATTTEQIPEGYGVDWDDNYAYIAGFTSWGFPYGVTWEQHEALNQAEAREPGEEDDDDYVPDDIDDDDDVPC